MRIQNIKRYDLHCAPSGMQPKADGDYCLFDDTKALVEELEFWIKEARNSRDFQAKLVAEKDAEIAELKAKLEKYEANPKGKVPVPHIGNIGEDVDVTKMIDSIEQAHKRTQASREYLEMTNYLLRIKGTDQVVTRDGKKLVFDDFHEAFTYGLWGAIPDNIERDSLEVVPVKVVD